MRPGRGQERGIPIVSSAVVQPPLSTTVFPGSFPPAPQLASRYPPSYPASYVNSLAAFQDDARRPAASPSSYPRLPQRLHQPIVNAPQALPGPRQQPHHPELQLNLQETVMPNDLQSAGAMAPGMSFVRDAVPMLGQMRAVVPTLHTPVGFTSEQLSVLRQQILVFRRMKEQDFAIEQEVLDLTKPTPLYALDKAEDGNSASAAQNRTALFRLDHGPEGTLPVRLNVAILLRREYNKWIQQRQREQIVKLERALKGPTQPGFPPPGAQRLSGIPYKGELMTQLRKLRLLMLQKKMRHEVEEHQLEVMKLNDRAYRKFVRDCNRTRFEMFKAGEKAKSDRAQEKAQAAKRMKVSLFDRASAFRDFRTLHNKGILRIHERQARSHNKQKDDDQVRRMEALKANDFEAYQELLLQQQQQSLTGPRDGGDRYEEITSFLTETEEYLNRLAAKIASVKISQEASEAAAKAISEARAQGLSEEEVQIAAREAAQEVAATTELTKRSLNFGEDAQSRYYSLAHSIEEEVRREPSYLCPPPGAFLRQYQIVGLQWMVSLYNNRLNGILADEMGLGKTVQVMALIAYIMEHKSDYGPHLIIVPNAVMVNWKAEFTQWLPTLRVVYYVGQKDERNKKYHQEVQAMQFNVLVTTYEFIMRDRSKLCRIQWHYIVIDEAQRMKDRQSKLAQDLNRFSAMRRLLLTGTPLQNDLRELWSLLNLLLPEVFDDKKCFTEWFGEVLGGGPADDKTKKDQTEWLEKEKRVVVIHRLHQILEPFMLRRQVQDVERKLPHKMPVVLKVAMTPYQSRLYNWVKATGTLRLDPYGPMIGQRRHQFAPLNNKVMELRKVCNHPLLSYSHQEYTLESLIRQCGKLSLLDRILIKLYKANHRVLLFSTMTKLLDLLEIYMKWRRMDDGSTFNYRRIDGGTSLEDREIAIRDFNQPGSDVFLFLLSIRAAGRGLNLQTADTVIIFDPDANPKNEEQAVARAYRIGQTKDVLVIYLETVADPLNYEALITNPVSGRRYVDSIESLVRKTIQKQKIEMASEVIDAGRFDMNTTNEQRKQTLENLLADEDRFKVATNRVPEKKEINQLIARSSEEEQLFNSLDESEVWPYDPLLECPQWMFFDDDDVMAALKTTSRHHMKKELKKREAAGWTRIRKKKRDDESMRRSLSAVDLDSKDQSSSYDPDLLENKTEMEDDEMEETFAAENISLDETDFRDEGSKIKSPTGVDIPQKRRSLLNRKPRQDLSALYRASCLRQRKGHKPSLKIRIPGFKRS